MDLYLWRHADALSGMSDFDRELSPLGHQQAGKVAEWFREQADPASLASLRILASPSARTRQTAAHFCKDENKIELCMPLYENARPEEILELLGWPDITAPTLVVGHQPQIGLLADLLLADTPHPGSFRKSALWWLRFTPGEKKVKLMGVMEA